MREVIWSGVRLPAAVLVILVLGRCCASAPAAEEPGQPREQIDRLIAQLGDQDYDVREQAQADLVKLGFEAFDALSAATTHEDPEVAARAKYLLRLMRVEWTVASDPPEVKKCLENYEFLDAAEQLSRMRRLAELPNGVGVAALGRLVRFEQSGVASKYAAVAILGFDPAGPGHRHAWAERPASAGARAQAAAAAAKNAPKAELAAVLTKQLGSSKRTAAQWLLAYVEFPEAPDATLARWRECVDAELTLLRESPGETRPDIVAALVYRQVGWLVQLDRKEDAIAATRTLLDLERGDAQSLTRLVDWLVEQRAWGVLDEVTRKFAGRFGGNPDLLYVLAQGYASQGKISLAEETADRAFALNPGKDAQHLGRHLQVAEKIARRGLYRWAVREYRCVIERATPGHPAILLAQYNLSRLLHDQGEDLEAAQSLQQLLEAVQKQPPGIAPGAAVELAKIRAQMHYFFAQHWAEKGDRAKQRDRLEKALTENPSDVEVLIACYHMPDATPEFRRKIVRLVQAEAAQAQSEIARDSDNPVPYNQYAWLIANTEGDRDEALRCSQKSLELAGHEAGYLDTLARCYYAQGDYEKAVKYQQEAVQLDPHSGLIGRQMELFRKTLKQHRGQQQEASPAGQDEPESGDPAK